MLQIVGRQCATLAVEARREQVDHRRREQQPIAASAPTASSIAASTWRKNR